jgi:ATP-dependent Clp protease ATP-binding subunit ClpA
MLAQEYQHDAVDTDHLMIGILCEKGSLGSQVLRDLDVDMRRAALEVRILHTVIDPLVTPIGLTEALQRVLALSMDESRWFGHHYIGTEHLLLALARSRAGAASELLRALTISPDQIRRRVRRLLNDGLTEVSIENAKHTARLSELSRRVLNAAEQLAPPDTDIGLEHLLVVLARERRSIASKLLRDCGLNLSVLETALPTLSDERVEEAVLEEVIAHAVDRADQLGTHYTGTDHILLALAQNTHGAALLSRYGANPACVIEALYKLLAPPT